MELLLERKWIKDKYTIGNLSVNGVFFSNTLEDKVRDINKNGIFDCGEVKIKGETAIPYGTYEITLDVYSPKFSKYQFYREVCNGRLPRLLNVPAFDGILIHCAEGPKGADLLQGCIAVGFNKIKGGLIDCKNTFKKLYVLMDKAHKKREKIIIKII